MSWWSAADEALLVAFWLFVPGTALAWAMRVRGLTAVLVAPAVSVGGLAVWAVLLGALGAPFTQPTMLLAIVATAGATVGIRRLAARMAMTGGAHRAASRTSPPARLAAMYAGAGVVVGGLLGAIPVMRGMVRPDLVPQAADTVFHLNAVRLILHTANASTLAVGQLTTPGHESFYPSAWHGVVALSTTGSVVVSSNLMVVAIAGLVFPAALAALARASSPGRLGVALLAPVVGAGFLAFPAQLFSWGALWPNALALALVPAAVAGTVKVLRSRTPGEKAAWTVLTLAGLAGVALSQPNAMLTYGIVATPLVLSQALRASMRRGRVDARPLRRLAGLLWPVLAAVVWCVVWLRVLELMNGQLRTLTRTWYSGFWHGIWIALTDSGARMPDTAPALAEMQIFHGSAFVGVVAAAGTVCVLFRRESRWLVGSLAGLLLFAGFADSVGLHHLTDAWFSDLFRLRATVPLASALVIAHGLDAVARAVTGAARRARPRAAATPALAGAVVIVVALAAVAVTGGMRAGVREEIVRHRYVELAVEGRGARTTPPEQAMIAQLRDEVTPGGVVLGNPDNGSALVSAIADVSVVFPTANGRWSADALYVGAHFDQIHSDPEVCAALDRLGVRYFYADPDVTPPPGGVPGPFAGLGGTAPQPGFDLVAEGGTARVYRITACG